MLYRLSPPLAAFGGSALLLAGLVGALWWISDPGPTLDSSAPLIVYCAEALRVPLTAIAKEYESEYKQKVHLRIGPSQTILTSLILTKDADVFLPADDSFVRDANEKKLLADVFNVATMHGVLIVSQKAGNEIKTWDDFVANGVKIGQANVETTAIGKMIKTQLTEAGLWDAVEKRNPKSLGNVNEVCNGVRFGSVDVGIVWDVIAQPHANELKIVRTIKELENLQANVQVAVVKSSTQQPQAMRFIRYLRAKDKGAPHLKKQGFSDVIEGDLMDERPELVVHAGAMLKPALEPALIEFEKRENVKIVRVYNGCGILVSQMKTGNTPDLYFACDLRFMTMVKDQFPAPINISSNQLYIIVQKGNPHQLTKLADLGKPGLKVGVGHEQQCALGALTHETFLRSGLFADIAKNVKTRSMSGDDLLNKVRVKSLDAVVAYRSNLKMFEDELDGIPITGLDCATPYQPVAVSKNSAHAEKSQRLMEFLKNEASKQRFEKMGFGWEVKAEK